MMGSCVANAPGPTSAIALSRRSSVVRRVRLASSTDDTDVRLLPRIELPCRRHMAVPNKQHAHSVVSEAMSG